MDDAIFNDIRQILVECLAVDAREITPAAKLVDLGSDSLDFMAIVVQLNKKFDLNVGARDVASKLAALSSDPVASQAPISNETLSDQESEGIRRVFLEVTVSSIVRVVKQELEAAGVSR